MVEDNEGFLYPQVNFTTCTQCDLCNKICPVTKEKKQDTGKETAEKPFFVRKLGMLSKMLWGGSALLAFEHIWHREIVPYFPFLTAMGNPNDAYEMLREMSTVGVTMALAVTAVWGVIVSAEYFLLKADAKTTKNVIK